MGIRCLKYSLIIIIIIINIIIIIIIINIEINTDYYFVCYGPIVPEGQSIYFRR